MKREVIRENIEKWLNQYLPDFENKIVAVQSSKNSIKIYFEAIPVVEVDTQCRHWEFSMPTLSQNDYYVFEGRGWLLRMVGDIVQQLNSQTINGVSYLEYVLQIKKFMKELNLIRNKVKFAGNTFRLLGKDGKHYNVYFAIARVFISDCSFIFSFFDGFESSELVDEIKQLLVFNINIIPAISFSYLLVD